MMGNGDSAKLALGTWGSGTWHWVQDWREGWLVLSGLVPNGPWHDAQFWRMWRVWGMVGGHGGKRECLCGLGGCR